MTPKELVHPSNELTAIGCVSEDDAQPAEPIEPTRLCDIHDRVENLPPLIPWWPTQPAPRWQILPDSCPFPVDYVAVVSLSVLHPKPCSKPFALVQAFSLTFFTGSEEAGAEDASVFAVALRHVFLRIRIPRARGYLIQLRAMGIEILLNLLIIEIGRLLSGAAL